MHYSGIRGTYKYALRVKLGTRPTLVLLHGPASAHLTYGICVKVEKLVFDWWLNECKTGTVYDLVAQDRKAGARYTLVLTKLSKLGAVRIKRQVYLPLNAFQHTLAKYIRPPRKKRT